MRNRNSEITCKNICHAVMFSYHCSSGILKTLHLSRRYSRNASSQAKTRLNKYIIPSPPSTAFLLFSLFHRSRNKYDLFFLIFYFR